jgi:hypothetical protein
MTSVRTVDASEYLSDDQRYQMTELVYIQQGVKGLPTEILLAVVTSTARCSDRPDVDDLRSQWFV